MTAPARRALLLLTVGALMLRAAGLGRQSVWMDEATQWLIATRPTPAEALDAARSGLDVNLPLYPLYHAVMWVWLHLGVAPTPFVVRLPSAVLSASLVPAVFLLARRLVPRSAWAAAVLAAVSPFAVYYGQEARMYALVAALAAWSALAWMRAVEVPTDLRRWGVYVVLRVLALYAHPYAIVLVVPELAFVLHRRPELVRRMVGALVAVGLCAVPWLVAAWSLRGTRAGQVRDLTGLEPAYSAFALLFGTTLGPSVAELHQGLRPGMVVPGVAVAAATTGVVMVAWLRRGSGRALLGGYVAAGLLTPLAAAVVAQAAVNPRYATAALPFLLLAFADGLRAVGPPLLRGVVTASTAVLVAVSLGHWWFDADYAKEDLRSAAAVVAQGYRPGDRVLSLTGPWPLQVYEPALPVETLYLSGGLDAHAWAALQDAGLPRGTTWVVRARPWETDPDGEVLAWLLAQGQVLRRTALPGAEVYELAVTQPGR